MYSLMAGAIRIEAASAPKRQHVGRAEERRLFTRPGIRIGTRRVGHARELEHPQLGGPIGVADHQLHQEPVELGFRQWIGPLVLDRVLGGQNPECLRER